MQIAVYGRRLPEEYSEDVLSLLTELSNSGILISLYKTIVVQFPRLSLLLPSATFFDEKTGPDEDTDCLISLGGDGTILDTIALVKNKGIPILGVNFGRLGFLTGASKEDFSKIVEDLRNRNYIVDRRTLLHLDANVPLFPEAPFALNDFTLTKRDAAPMVKVHTFLNGEYLNTYYADGLIVSTPTGSTGYSMSCNGPIVFPDSASFVITPIAPHHLNTRPIIVPDDNVISFEIESRTDDFICTLDARREIINKTVQLAVRKEIFTVKLVRFNGTSFLSTLRNKLSWGLDKRNS